MPDTVTPPRSRSGPPPSRPPSSNGPRKWSHEPHHRRRRTFAGLTVLVLIVIVLIVAGSGGGSSPQPVTIHRAGLFGRIQTLSGAGPKSFSGIQTAAENAAIDRTLAYTPAIMVAGAQHREVALTFDDGPGPYTEQLVSVLNQMDVPATFFEVGAGEQYFHAGTRDIAAHGYPIEDHTWSHPRCRSCRSPTSARRSLARRAEITPLRRAVPAALPPALRGVEQRHARAAEATSRC